MAEELERLQRITPEAEYSAGEALYKAGRVSALDSENGQMLRYIIEENPRRVVRIHTGRLGGFCSCDFFGNVHRPCRHLIAAFLAASASGTLEEARRKKSRADAQLLLDTLHTVLPDKTFVRMELTIRLLGEKEPLRISLKVGKERLYVVKSMAQFLDALDQGSSISFGKGFALEPDWMRFEPEDEEILKLLKDAAYVRKLEGNLPQTGPEAKFLVLPERFAGNLLRLLENRNFRISYGEEVYPAEGISEERVRMSFAVSGSGREIEINAGMPASLRVLDPDGKYACCEGEVLRLQPEQKELVAAIRKAGTEGQASFRYGIAQCQKVISELLPELERAGEVSVDGALAGRIIRRPLTVRSYFDRDGNKVLCRLNFLYGNEEIDPFSAEQPKEPEEQNVLMFRDSKAEHRVMDILASYGFCIRRGQVMLSDSEAVYGFLTEGISKMQEISEVYCSDAFRKMEPRRPQFTGSLRMQEGTMRLALQEQGEPTPEVLAILEALRSRKKYFRLKDGNYLDLSEMGEWQEIADAAVEGRMLAERESFAERTDVEISSCRAVYLVSLLENSKAEISADEETLRLGDTAEAGDPCPAPLNSMLRPYQLRGFAWLQNLHRLRMGGILADDMGLGKTIQVIALLLWAARGEKERRPSVVVAPTTLIYNWKAEIERFAPELRVMTAAGLPPERQQQIELLKDADCGTDVYITSYPLVRRDIGVLSKVQFRFAVLDEAQYIKNALSIGSGAVRQLKADTRLALTGTPMENHPGELWSIFDFVLPGYLLSFSQFMHRFGSGEEMDVLRRKIRPFLLRRLKEDVLDDLPEKQETTLLAEMTEEQKNVYRASLLRLKPQMDSLLERRNRIAVLSAITELRQICGHPALVQPDYAASSGKVELLLDILPGSLEAGHRALIFSPFTGMLKILQRRLEMIGVTCLYLDGQTPAKRRMELVTDFNSGTGQVFLISLKAGGSGLNLTGADTVIHFDPWWNPAAEDQATDRAHRIGQKRAVTVIWLITRGTIEEQMVRLGDRKRELFDQMITAGEAMPSELTPEDIRALFTQDEN